MEFRYFIRTLQRGWWLVLISVIVAVNISLVYSYYFTTPLYKSTARFIVSPNLETFDQSKDLASSLATLDKRSIINTYGEVIKSRQVYESTLELLNKASDVFSEYEVSVVVLPETNILQLSVIGPHPKVTAILANSIGKRAIEYINDLYQVFDIDFIDQAVVSYEPVEPQPLQDPTLAMVIGAVIGVGLAIVRDQFASSLEGLSQRRMVDSKSSAYTRTHFERLLRQEIANQPNGVFALGFIYLNGIQDVYDSLPQTYINQIMREVTDTLNYQLRGNDIIGRWTKLKFSLLLPTTPGISAERTLARIRETLDQPLSLDTQGKMEVLLDPRIGVALAKSGELFVDLVDHAEQALELALQSEHKIHLYVSDKSEI